MSGLGCTWVVDWADEFEPSSLCNIPMRTFTFEPGHYVPDAFPAAGCSPALRVPAYSCTSIKSTAGMLCRTDAKAPELLWETPTHHSVSMHAWMATIPCTWPRPAALAPWPYLPAVVPGPALTRWSTAPRQQPKHGASASKATTSSRCAVAFACSARGGAYIWSWKVVKDPKIRLHQLRNDMHSLFEFAIHQADAPFIKMRWCCAAKRGVRRSCARQRHFAPGGVGRHLCRAISGWHLRK